MDCSFSLKIVWLFLLQLTAVTFLCIISHTNSMYPRWAGVVWKGSDLLWTQPKTISQVLDLVEGFNTRGSNSFPCLVSAIIHFWRKHCTIDTENYQLWTRVKANSYLKGKRNIALYFIRPYKCQCCREVWPVLDEPHLPLAAGEFLLLYTKPSWSNIVHRTKSAGYMQLKHSLALPLEKYQK